MDAKSLSLRMIKINDAREEDILSTKGDASSKIHNIHERKHHKCIAEESNEKRLLLVEDITPPLHETRLITHVSAF